MHDVHTVECNVNCHKKCQKFIPNLCGVNQKILAEELSSIRMSQSSTKSQELESPVCCNFYLKLMKSFYVRFL